MPRAVPDCLTLPVNDVRRLTFAAGRVNAAIMELMWRFQRKEKKVLQRRWINDVAEFTKFCIDAGSLNGFIPLIGFFSDLTDRSLPYRSSIELLIAQHGTQNVCLMVTA